MDWKKHIHSDPKTLAGKPIVKGTRLSIDFILGLYAKGWSESQILENYPNLSREKLLAVFAYASESLRETTLFAFPSEIE